MLQHADINYNTVLSASTTVLKDTSTLTTSNSSATDKIMDIQYIHSDLTSIGQSP